MNGCIKKAYFKGIGIGWIRKRFGDSLFEVFVGIGLFCSEKVKSPTGRQNANKSPTATTSADEPI